MYYDLYVTSHSHSPTFQDSGYLKDMIRLRTVLIEYFREHGLIEGEDYNIDIVPTPEDDFCQNLSFNYMIKRFSQRPKDDKDMDEYISFQEMLIKESPDSLERIGI